MSLGIIGAIWFNIFLSYAQPAVQEVTLDPNVTKGVLENGLTYFIRNNAKPENKAELRLVINAGSIQEDEGQEGLAHFMEHMCFNGTENFEKNELVDYLQSVGVRFGAHLNAYTSFDETVYMLSIPTDEQDIVEKAFQILEDWAHQVNLEEEEVNKERGVVIEEWRIGRGAQQRLRDQYLPVIFYGSRYAERLPIGKKEVIETFSRESLVKFYRDWYRPDLMAVVVVGDLDTDTVEAKIKQYFGRLTMPENPRERVVYEVPSHDSTLLAIASDKEMAFSQVQLLYKHAKKDLSGTEKIRNSILRQLYGEMLNSRLQELSQQANPPFLFGASYFGNLVRSKEAYQSFASVNDTSMLMGLKTLVIENERVKRFGFTEREFERAKSNLLSSYEKAFKERDKSESRNYASEYVSAFLADEPSPGIEFEFNFLQQELPKIQLQEVNELAGKWITEKNRAIVITAPEKEGVILPTRKEIFSVLEEVENVRLTPYEENEIADKLINEVPISGQVLSIKEIEAVNAKEIIFENGLTVVLKSTDYKNDEILMKGMSKGGHSLYPIEDYQSAANADQIVGESGIGNFSSTDLQKYLAGKNVYVQPYIGQLSEGLNGSSSPKDIQTLLELTYLYMTSVREDSIAYQSYISKQKSLLQNLMADPRFYFSDKVSKIMTQNHPRGGGFPTPEDLDDIDLERAYEIYKERFKNAGDFTFFFVGNFDPDSLLPLISTYLGGLPGNDKEEHFKDLGIRPPEASMQLNILRGSDPKSLVRVFFTGELKNYDDQLNYELKSLGELLSIKLIELLREEQSGVYSVGASAYAVNDPYPHYQLQISFPCSPENVDTLIQAAFSVLKDIQIAGPDSADVHKVKEAQRRELQVSMEQNRFWLNIISDFYWDGKIPKDLSVRKSRIESLNSESIQNIARKFFDLNQYAQFVLLPENQSEMSDMDE